MTSGNEPGAWVPERAARPVTVIMSNQLARVVSGRSQRVTFRRAAASRISGPGVNSFVEVEDVTARLRSEWSTNLRWLQTEGLETRSVCQAPDRSRPEPHQRPG